MTGTSGVNYFMYGGLFNNMSGLYGTGGIFSINANQDSLQPRVCFETLTHAAFQAGRGGENGLRKGRCTMTGTSGVNYFMYGGLFNNMSGLYGTGGIFSINANQSRLSLTNYKTVGRPSYGSSSLGNGSQNALGSWDAREYLAAVKDFGSKLRSATAGLSTAGQSVFNKMTGVSSKNDALSVSVAKQAEAKKFFDAKGAKDVTVQQLASAQQNKGTSLNAAALSNVNAGINQFTVAKDGKTFNFTVDVKITDSSRTAQQKAADAINRQKIGVTAAVEYDDKTKKSSLVLKSNETGAKGAFSVADAAGGQLVKSLGIGQATQEARNAIYTVNGDEKTSEKNTVDLGDGLTGTLNKVSAEPIKVTVGKDTGAVASAVSDMVKGFNGLMKAAKENESDRGAQVLRQRLDNLSAAYAPSLKNAGITRSKDGYLELDEKKLGTALESGYAERNLGGSSGFTQRLSQLAKSADANPSQFLSYQSRSNMNAPDVGINFYQSQKYSNISLLLNMGI